MVLQVYQCALAEPMHKLGRISSKMEVSKEAGWRLGHGVVLFASTFVHGSEEQQPTKCGASGHTYQVPPDGQVK